MTPGEARHSADPMDRTRFPADPWRLRETSYHPDDLGLTETLFTVANGYLGLRANPSEGRDAHAHGTFVNGFHETWPIHHAEAAYGFARTGQTIVNAPDAKVIKLYVDDEPFILGTADVEQYERVLDMRSGILERRLVWRTPAGKRVRIDSRTMVSMTQRHLALLSFEVTMLTGDAPIVISSQLINRQDGEDEYHVPSAALGEGVDPRKAQRFVGRVLMPRMSYAREHRMLLGYVCARSRMTIAVAADHLVTSEQPVHTTLSSNDDLAKTVFRVEAREGQPVRIDKFVAYHTSKGVPVPELADRCDRTLDRARTQGIEHQLAEQRTWYDGYWGNADVQIETATPEADPAVDRRHAGQSGQTTAGSADAPSPAALQQAVRFNLFSLAQASARADQSGVPAKGVTGSGYEGHYFWDTEVYVVPFLTYTMPEVARNTLHFRTRMLESARARAGEMALGGALFPWRTINGEEASAYYAAGTAQVHIDADIAYALTKYVAATGDHGFMIRDGVDLLVETARMWADLGFWRSNAEQTFHIHGVTGPDEYTTVVNNNLFTNVMARYNLEQAVQAVDELEAHHPEAHAAMVARLSLADEEVGEWRACATGMVIPFAQELGIHPQDDYFLDREVWDLSQTPETLRPLLLHFHPLVIYRFQVLKQADVVLALFLQGDRFTQAQKRADFEYYDPITTGDSTLSGVVQSIMAAEVGYHELALRYFYEGLYVDLDNLHDNTIDGLHIASAGGVWRALVSGFGGMRDHGGQLSFEPRLPRDWSELSFRLRWRGSRLHVRLRQDSLTLTVDDGTTPVGVRVLGKPYDVAPGSPITVPVPDQGPRLPGVLGDKPLIGGRRPDGTMITAGVPEPSVGPDPAESDPDPAGI
ncbi:MAG: glycoside hydrolase family 65 protein [Nocardioides sp.]